MIYFITVVYVLILENSKEDEKGLCESLSHFNREVFVLINKLRMNYFRKSISLYKTFYGPMKYH